jgi:hypothetical protein
MRKFLGALVLGLGVATAGVAAADDYIAIDDAFDDFDGFDDFVNPVPEPTGALLMGLGVAIASYASRDRRA